LVARDATFGMGAIHPVIGDSQDEDAGDDDIRLDQYEVTVLKGMASSYIDQEKI
jgi:hypothetical protein